jgi:hypothetical protein
VGNYALFSQTHAPHVSISPEGHGSSPAAAVTIAVIPPVLPILFVPVLHAGNVHT